MAIEIRRLTSDDVDIWRELRLEALSHFPENFLTTHAEEAARSDAERAEMLGRRRVFFAAVDGVPAGTAALDPETAAPEAHRVSLNAFYARPAFHGGGVAQALVDHVIAVASSEGFLQIELIVASDNPRAIRFYARNGFVPWGRLPRAVRLPDRYQDDLYMMRALDGYAAPADP